MNSEYEIKFYIDVEKIQQCLKKLEAKLVQKDTLMKRWIFTFFDKPNQWVRVRDEGDRVTTTLKLFDGQQNIESVKEVEMVVSDFNAAFTIFSKLKFDTSRYVENYREVWAIENCYIMVDRYPALDTFVEIEGSSKEVVLALVNQLGLDVSKGVYGPTALLYQEKYKISRSDFEAIEKITFANNPFNN